jgi:SNF2 family DNA or RNA helicase
MINADAIETAAERLGIKTTTTAGIFEKILGDQYHTLKLTSKLIKFIAEQRIKAGERCNWTEEAGTYGVRRLEKFEEITVAYPDIDRFLEEQLAKYTEQKDKCMVTLNRIKEHITEGECPVCCDDMKEDCDGKVLIYKCCSVIICESCTFSTIFKMAHKGSCPNCRAEIDLKQLIYISKDVDLDKLVQEVEDGEVTPENETSANCEFIPPPVNVQPLNYGKFDAIVDIIRGIQPPLQTPIHVHIPQLLAGNAELPEPTSRKVLIFANYDETLYKIRSKLEDEKVNYEQLNGTPTQINEIVERFKNTNTHNVLLVCAARYCAGLNLQNASDLIFAHFIMDNNVETQVAGRLIRLGRTTNAKFHYVLYESEYEYMMRTERMYEL